jgi:DNA helicase-2/ATP-dependent DNA helicase PcrA
MREQTEGLTLREIIELVLDQSGLVEHYRADREGADRLENLEELVNAAESFVTQEGFGRDAVAMLPEHQVATLSASPTQSPASQGVDMSRPLIEADNPLPPDADTGETLSPLAAFLSHAALEAGDNQAQAGQDAVQLMTVHSSKGLEFDAVFITGLEEGLFPHENSMSDHEGLEEERRLMYVAITRARKRLYLSHSQTRLLHGQTRFNLRSRFFDELPETALKWLTPKGGAMSGVAPGFSHRGQAAAYGASRTGTDFSAYSTSAPVPAQKAEPPQGLRAGMKVFHNKFGEGQVLTVEGSGADARAQVSFSRHGVKWLALSVAKLTPI